jgi:hypothetical protein
MTAAVTSMMLASLGGSVSLLSETTAYDAACSTPLTTGRKTLVDALVRNLMTDGIWSGLDWLLLCAAESEQAGRVNLANPAKVATNVNSCTHDVDLGFTGDGVSMHISLGEALGDASNFVLNSAAFGVWCNEQNGSGAKYHTGTNNGGRAFILARASSGNETFEVNDSTASVLQGNPDTRLGHRAASRTGAAIKRGYFNGTRVADLTTASALITNSTQYLLRSGSSYGPDRIAAFWSGAGLDDTGIANMHARLGTFLTAIGAN